jgi:hypothetical protein
MDSTLVALGIGSIVLYYNLLYEVMKRNKKQNGSYWKS